MEASCTRWKRIGRPAGRYQTLVTRVRNAAARARALSNRGSAGPGPIVTRSQLAATTSELST
jgi:hypothetical protein